MIPRTREEAEKLHLVLWPDTVLRKKCEWPGGTTAEDVKFLVARMQQLLATSGGLGLAAPQVGVPLRLFIISPTISPLASVFHNPTVMTGGIFEEMNEGCLSLPGLYSNIRRATNCIIRSENHVNPILLRGRPAQVAQHEREHLDGKLQLAKYWRGQK